jgi:hypothetical protein
MRIGGLPIGLDALGLGHQGKYGPAPEELAMTPFDLSVMDLEPRRPSGDRSDHREL